MWCTLIISNNQFELYLCRVDETPEDPLVNPVIPPWMLEQMDFGPKYEHTEQLLYWLSRWSGRNHGIGGKVGTLR